MSNDPFVRLIRLKPYNPRKGYVTRRYHVRGTLFREDRGWYECKDPEFADYLEKLHQRSGDEDSPLLFDVCTREEAQAIEEREASSPNQASVSAPNPTRRTTVTSQDTARDRERKVDPNLPMIDPAAEDEKAEADAAAAEEAGRVRELGRLNETKAPATPDTRRKRGAPAGQPARQRSMRSGE